MMVNPTPFFMQMIDLSDFENMRKNASHQGVINSDKQEKKNVFFNRKTEMTNGRSRLLRYLRLQQFFNFPLGRLEMQ